MASSVLYSVAMPLNRGGMGTIAWHACAGLQHAGRLRWVLSTDVSAAGSLTLQARGMPWFFRDTMRVLNRLRWHRPHDIFFDRWASCWLEEGMGYYGWMNQSLACIHRCRRYGGRAVIDRGSVEPRLHQRWLAVEYARYGLHCDPIASQTMWRMIQEADETDVIAVPSRLVMDSYLAEGYKPSGLMLNPLGVDAAVYGDRTERPARQLIRFVFAGQLSIQKGIPDLLKAWKRLSPEKAELVLAGVIPSREEAVIQPLLRDAPSVVWDGHCRDVAALFRSCDVLLLPSAQDGFGMVVLEAFAAGLPVIVSDRVGAKDCVEEGRNGFVFRFGDGRALEERLEWFIQDPGRSRLMGRTAIETARQHTWEDYGRRVASLFHDS